MRRTALLISLSLLSATALGGQPGLKFNLSAKDIRGQCDAALARAAKRLSALAEIPKRDRSLDNTPRALDLIQDDLNAETAAQTFLKYVSTDSFVRQAAHECEAQVGRFDVDIFSREDLYKAVQDYAARGESLQGEDAKLLKKTLLDFKRNGLELPTIERARVNVLKKQIVDLELDYGKNLDDVTDFMRANSEDLDGLPEDFIHRLDKLSDGTFKVTLDYPDYYPFMENARSPQARAKLYDLFENRAFPQNVAILEEAVALRQRVARLLGYKDWATYVLEDRMAKDPATVLGFLSDLRKKLTKKAKPELKALLALKRRDEKGAKEIESEDYFYYHNQIKKEKYAIDEEKIKQYFPLETVTTGLLAVYEELLGVRFHEVVPARAWHPDVKLFEVRDAVTTKLIGRFYMDLFPRDGKYKHAASFSLIGGRLDPDGTYREPAAAIVANFNKPSVEEPSLLRHDEVVTYFHEFGHIMHQVLTRAKYPRFSGSKVAQDFVEAPSQMLENWVWNPEILKKLSGYYKDPSEKLPDYLLKRMIEARNLDSGLRYLRQVLYATADMTFHTHGAENSNQTYRELADQITLIPMRPDTHPTASFGHIMGGYDAAYYGYLWSEVYADDMFSRFEKEGVLNAGLGREYRRLILEPGGGADEGEELRRFLGREPTEDAFLRTIGLRAPAEPMP